MHFLHDFCNIIHTDIKAENVMLSMPIAETEKIIQDEIEKASASRKRFVIELRKKFKLAEFCNHVDKESTMKPMPLNLTKKQKKQLKKKQKKKEKKNKQHNQVIGNTNSKDKEMLIQENKENKNEVLRNF